MRVFPNYILLHQKTVLVMALVLLETRTAICRKIEIIQLTARIARRQSLSRWLYLQGTLIWDERLMEEKGKKKYDVPDLISAKYLNKFCQRIFGK